MQMESRDRHKKISFEFFFRCDDYNSFMQSFFFHFICILVTVVLSILGKCNAVVSVVNPNVFFLFISFPSRCVPIAKAAQPNSIYGIDIRYYMCVCVFGETMELHKMREDKNAIHPQKTKTKSTQKIFKR